MYLLNAIHLEVFLPSNMRRHCTRIGLRRRRMVPVGRRPGDAGEDRRPLRPPRHPEGEHPGIYLCVENMSGRLSLPIVLLYTNDSPSARTATATPPLPSFSPTERRELSRCTGSYVCACEGGGVFQVFSPLHLITKFTVFVHPQQRTGWKPAVLLSCLF